jgi:hypothetical protein
MTPQEKLIWLLGDLMDGVENFYGTKNPKRSGHINSAALRIIDEVIAPYADRIEALEQHKRLQTEDVMNLGAQLGQAWLRIEQLEAALREIAAAPVFTVSGTASLQRIARAALEPPPARQENDDVYPGFRGNNEA